MHDHIKRGDVPSSSLGNELFAEESTLFLSVFKWSILAGLAGAIVGGATAIFLYLLRNCIAIGNSITHGHPYYLLPLAMPIVVFVIRKLAPSAEGHGTEKVIEAVHMQNGAIDIGVVPVKLAATLLTIGTGGSVGKEGPAAQIGAGLAYNMARILRLNKADAKRLVICGISAGFAAVFGTPISGAIFGAEVLYLGLLQYDALFPCLVSGVVSNFVCRADRSVPLINAVPQAMLRAHTRTVIVSLLSGIFFGIVALLLIKAFAFAESINERIHINRELKALLAGIVLVGIFLISPQSAGLSTDSIRASFLNSNVPLLTCFWKIIATSVTLGFGGSGGVVTPIFTVGSTSGFALAKIIGMPIPLMSALGMVAVLAAAANTPIAASIMALELFGPTIGTYAAIACATAYIVVGHRGVYPSQILGATKCASIEVPQTKIRIDAVPALNIHLRRNSLLYWIGKLFRGRNTDK